MNNLESMPSFAGRSFLRVNEGLFGEAVKQVIRVAGPMDDEQAMRIVEAVCGPLRLLPPVDDATDEYYRSVCNQRYFKYEGGWRFCIREHGADDDEPEYHRSSDGTEWNSECDERAFGPHPYGSLNR